VALLGIVLVMLAALLSFSRQGRVVFFAVFQAGLNPPVKQQEYADAGQKDPIPPATFTDVVQATRRYSERRQRYSQVHETAEQTLFQGSEQEVYEHTEKDQQ